MSKEDVAHHVIIPVALEVELCSKGEIPLLF